MNSIKLDICWSGEEWSRGGSMVGV